MKKEESRLAGSTVFEGMTSLRAIISAYNSPHNDRVIERVLVDESRKKAKAKEIGWLNHISREQNFTVEFVSENEIDALTTGSTHGGIIALCSERHIPRLDENSVRSGGFYVMLEGIEDPYNFGYALRSLYTCGADGVILSPRNWMSAAGVVCRSSAGASEMMPAFECDGVRAAEIFSSLGYKIVCAGIRDSVSSFEADLKKPLLLIVGGEKRGISSALLEKADLTVRIDYGRVFGGSLSAASAASMLAYEILRQNHHAEPVNLV